MKSFIIKINTIFAAIFFMAVIPSIAYADNASDNDELFFAIFIISIICIGIYFLPTIIAFYRGHPNRWVIFVINFAFGLTMFGWLICLIWSLNAIHVPSSGNRGGESGLNIFVNDEKSIRINQNQISSIQELSIADYITELEKIKKLRDIDAISQEEHDILRQKILSRIK